MRLSAALKQLTGRSRRECLELLADLEEGEASPVAEMSVISVVTSLRFLEAEPVLPVADAAAGLRERTERLAGLPARDEALLLPEPERRREGGLLDGPEEREGWRDPLGIVLRR